jgi:translocator protein
MANVFAIGFANGIDWLPILVAAGVAIAVGLAGGLLTDIGPWYRGLAKPSWNPPDWAFGPAWTLIFTLTATTAVMTWWVLPDDTARTTLLTLYAINCVLNITWSAIFFRMRRPDWALLELVLLWLSIAALIAFTLQWRPAVAWCLVPYLAWVSFAGVLNRAVAVRNAPFGRAAS